MWVLVHIREVILEVVENIESIHRKREKKVFCTSFPTLKVLKGEKVLIKEMGKVTRQLLGDMKYFSVSEPKKRQNFKRWV